MHAKTNKTKHDRQKPLEGQKKWKSAGLIARQKSEMYDKTVRQNLFLTVWHVVSKDTV